MPSLNAPSTPTDKAHREPPIWLGQVAGPVFLAGVYVLLAAVSWRKWPDFLIDFGRELYSPWQLASGQLLYTNVASLFGPFSQHWNALWFKTFGVSFMTLTFSNLLIIAFLLCLLYDFFAKASDRFTATLTCTAFLALFAFAHPLNVGSYNFVSPYSHEATHGVVLSVFMLWCFSRRDAKRRLHLYALAGGSLSLVFLTKPEVFVAGASAAALALSLPYVSGSASEHPRRGFLLAFAAGFVIPIAIFLAYFSLRMPLGESLRAMAGAWAPIITVRPLSSSFYLSISGFADPLGSAWTMLKTLAWLASVFSVGVLLDWGLRRFRSYLVLLGSVAASILIILSAATLDPSLWLDLGLPVPLLTGLIIAVLVRQSLKNPDALRSEGQQFPLLIWAVFSLVLLGKTVLNTRLYHYGFYLAFPATLLCISVLVHDIPRVLAARWGGGGGGGRGRGGRLFRAFASVVVLLLIGVLFGMSFLQYRAKSGAVGTGNDLLFIRDPDLDPASEAIVRALGRIEEWVPVDATLLVLPEGAMFNYLARRRSPTRYINFMPPELDALGEDNMLAALREEPPDFIMLVHKDTRADYKVSLFGASPGYGRGIMEWVRANYHTLETILDEPLKDDRFGIAILARTASASSLGSTKAP